MIVLKGLYNSISMNSSARTYVLLDHNSHPYLTKKASNFYNTAREKLADEDKDKSRVLSSILTKQLGNAIFD